MKRVKFKRKLTPPGNGEPTEHVMADWVIRHEDQYEIHFGNEEWNLSTKPVQSITDTDYPFSPVEPDEDTRDSGYEATRVKCPMCANQFGVSPDFDTGMLTCHECNNNFYGHLHIQNENAESQTREQ